MQLPAHIDPSESSRQSEIPDLGIVAGELARAREVIDKELCEVAQPEGGKSVLPTKSLEKAISYLRRQVGRGKMLRPALVLLSYRACLSSCDASRLSQSGDDELIRIAAIVEMTHNATLLHDDVIDEGQKRRSLPTANRLWGNEFAILLGDLLLCRVFRMCTQLQPRATSILAETTARICRGELRQIIQRQNWELTESEYIDIITEKSASLFTDCCRLGALTAGADETRIEALGCFGCNVGIAFQITDDLLDMIGDEDTTGKTLGRDVYKNELTLSMIHMLAATDRDGRAAAIRRLTIAARNNSHHPQIVEMLNSHGSLEYVQKRAEEFVTGAVKALSCLEKSDAVSVLTATAAFAAQRGR